MSSRIVLALALAGAALTAQAQTCDHNNIRPSAPAARFIVDSNKGTVLDTRTGLTWKRWRASPARLVSAAQCT